MNPEVPISIDYSYLAPEVSPQEIAALQPAVTLAHQTLHDKSGLGSDFLGWLDPEAIMPAGQVADTKATVARLRKETDILVVIGIGGSYLGARTVIESLAAPGGPTILYAGQTLSSDYTAQLLKALEGKTFAINVVSKSGTTTEPAVAFRLLRDLLIRNVGKEKANSLIVATTDPASGALRKVSAQEGYTTFPIPPNVGGRFSVFTAVGMLPIAFAGIDIEQLLQGAINCAKACASPDMAKNPAYVYAAVRNLLYRKGKAIELMATFEPRVHYLAEWWKQLYGESEGKNLMGIFPASVEFTTDLHSMGQWIQEGRRSLFETFINIAGSDAGVAVPADADNADGLNFLAGMPIDAVNRRAFEGTALAHRDGGVPSMTITIPELSPYAFGALLYFFEKACGVSGYLLGVNPFNQPGVEAYKKNMFALMKKPGFESESEQVLAAVKERAGKNIVSF